MLISAPTPRRSRPVRRGGRASRNKLWDFIDRFIRQAKQTENSGYVTPVVPPEGPRRGPAWTTTMASRSSRRSSQTVCARSSPPPTTQAKAAGPRVTPSTFVNPRQAYSARPSCPRSRRREASPAIWSLCGTRNTPSRAYLTLRSTTADLKYFMRTRAPAAAREGPELRPVPSSRASRVALLGLLRLHRDLRHLLRQDRGDEHGRRPPRAQLGSAFSAYLTYEELFVIHAVCQWWCVASAIPHDGARRA